MQGYLRLVVRVSLEFLSAAELRSQRSAGRRMAIPRTCTYHRARRDVSAFLRALRFRTPRGPTDACPVAQVERAVAEHVGAEHAVAFSSARSAVFHVLAGLRAEPGDEVILPAP